MYPAAVDEFLLSRNHWMCWNWVQTYELF